MGVKYIAVQQDCNKMGNCFGKCLPKHEEHSTNFNILPNSTSDLTYQDNKPVLHLVDGLLNNQNNYSRLKEPSSFIGSSTSNDIQLQCLDVRALIPHTNQSSPTASLDLEWEHETIPFFMVHDQSENSNTSISRCPSASSFESAVRTCRNSERSQMSSENSLEWDSLCPVSSQVSEVDTDTQLLIGEIERLTEQTLLETGQELLR